MHTTNLPELSLSIVKICILNRPFSLSVGAREYKVLAARGVRGDIFLRLGLQRLSLCEINHEFFYSRC